MTSFETSLQTGVVFKRTLSKIYAVLQQNKGQADIGRIRWERDQREISPAEWYYIHILIRTVSINSAIRENFDKLGQRWYMTPLTVHKMFPELDDLQYVGGVKRERQISDIYSLVGM